MGFHYPYWWMLFIYRRSLCYFVKFYLCYNYSFTFICLLNLYHNFPVFIAVMANTEYEELFFSIILFPVGLVNIRLYQSSSKFSFYRRR